MIKSISILVLFFFFVQLTYSQQKSDTVYFDKGIDYLQEQKFDTAISIFSDIFQKNLCTFKVSKDGGIPEQIG